MKFTFILLANESCDEGIPQKEIIEQHKLMDAVEEFRDYPYFYEVPYFKETKKKEAEVVFTSSSDNQPIYYKISWK